MVVPYIDDGPVNMTANLSITDRPVSEFSPSFRPSNADLSAAYRNEEPRTLQNTNPSSPPGSPQGDPPHRISKSSPTMYQTPLIPSPRPLMTSTQGLESTTSAQGYLTHRTTASVGWNPGMDISALDADTSRNHGLPKVGNNLDSQPIQCTWEEQQAWEAKERQVRLEQAAAAAERAERAEREMKAEEEWHAGEKNRLRDEQTAYGVSLPFGLEGQSQNRENGNSQRLVEYDEEQPSILEQPKEDSTPALPPRISQEGQRRPVENNPLPQLTIPIPSSSQSRSDFETPQSKTKRQRSETYQIKQINWHDASSTTNPRRSPILIQNANGPCPLLALVNALVLSTPADTTTALVETLRVREQVSLGLLLDAVFDELMSGRRGGAAQELPDVSDLYSFLVTLHTGMNVNPRFVASRNPVPNIMDASLLDLPASINEDRKPGAFEETREMRLYSTFNIPLIHGWLVPRSHPAYKTLERSAKTYEDAQNLLFREEELEEKLSREVLNSEEQNLLGDIYSIKSFLSSSATQLSDFGLRIITEAMYPGSIAILFRNDHFSTLYKHPQSGQLLTLVTDMGYAGHEEVVWESLVDVSGEGCEFFAGDFRPVGNTAGDTQPQRSSMVAEAEGWTTVHGSRNTTRKSKISSTTSPPSVGNSEPRLDQTTVLPTSPATEQEDHDLALALQLQEEEEDRHRRETAARLREEDLSQALLISEEPSNQRGRGRGQEIRPLIPPRGTVLTRGSNEDGPPPSYEQAAQGRAYHPPPNHPAHPQALPDPGRPSQMQGRQMSAYSQNAAVQGGDPSLRHMSGQWNAAGQGGDPSLRHMAGQRRSSGVRVSGVRGPQVRGPQVRVPGVNVHMSGPGVISPSVTRRRSAGVGGSALDVDTARKDKDGCVMM